MKNYGQIAEDNFYKGYNCAQSVFCAFCEDYGIDHETGLKLASSFGGGMARLREVCGAVSGMFMVAGLIYGYTNTEDITFKTEHYKRIQELAAQFKEQYDTIICRELLKLDVKKSSYVPEPRTAEYYKKRPCGRFVRCAADILAKYIEEHPVESK